MKKRAVFRWLAIGAGIAAIRLALHCISLAVQRRLNSTLAKPTYKVPTETLEFHNRLLIADLHCDALLWDTDLTKRNVIGHVDVPRLQAGNVALQVFGVVTSVPAPENDLTFGDRTDLITLLSLVELWPPATWFSLVRRALYQAHKLRRIEARSRGRLTIVRSAEELRSFLSQRGANRSKVAAILSLEGAQALSGKLSNVDVLYEAGFRIVGLTHLSDNQAGGASTGTDRYGLTDYGRDVLKRLEQRGMLIDLAHASPTLIKDVLAITSRPVLVTHTGVKGVCPKDRNLGDDELGAIAGRGGLIGIGYDALFNCAPGVLPIVRSIDYVARLVGVDHVALGSDFDGLIKAPFDAPGLPLITHELKKEGFTQEEIEAIMGENVMRFLTQNLP